MSVKGLDTFFDVLAVIKNPASFEKKLKDIQAEVEKYEKVIESIVGLQSVQSFIKDIEKNKQAAELLVKEAQVSAETQRQSTQQYVDQQLASLKDVEGRLQQEQATLTSLSKDIKNKEKELSKKEKELLEKDIQLQQKDSYIQNLTQELEERKQKLMRAFND